MRGFGAFLLVIFLSGCFSSTDVPAGHAANDVPQPQAVVEPPSAQSAEETNGSSGPSEPTSIEINAAGQPAFEVESNKAVVPLTISVVHVSNGPNFTMDAFDWSPAGNYMGSPDWTFRVTPIITNLELPDTTAWIKPNGNWDGELMEKWVAEILDIPRSLNQMPTVVIFESENDHATDYMYVTGQARVFGGGFAPIIALDTGAKLPGPQPAHHPAFAQQAPPLTDQEAAREFVRASIMYILRDSDHYLFPDADCLNIDVHQFRRATSEQTFATAQTKQAMEADFTNWIGKNVTVKLHEIFLPAGDPEFEALSRATNAVERPDVPTWRAFVQQYIDDHWARLTTGLAGCDEVVMIMVLSDRLDIAAGRGGFTPGGNRYGLAFSGFASPTGEFDGKWHTTWHELGHAISANHCHGPTLNDWGPMVFKAAVSPMCYGMGVQELGYLAANTWQFQKLMARSYQQNAEDINGVAGAAEVAACMEQADWKCADQLLEQAGWTIPTR